MSFLNALFSRRLRNRRRERAAELELARRITDENRIVLIAATATNDGESDLLSDSRTGEIHRIFESQGGLGIDAAPIVRRLLARDLTLRNIRSLSVNCEENHALLGDVGQPFLGAHFVLDERLRHIYRVFLTPRCCVVHRLWGKGVDEIYERPLGGALIAWRDWENEEARAALLLIHAMLPESQAWGLRFVSEQTEPGSDIERRLFVGAHGGFPIEVRHHSRRSSSESAIEIASQGRVLLIESRREGRKISHRIRSETSALPF